ncbi:MAG: hypothetical protein R3B69_00345 [Candidatus Paceibacterota bacterium]
MQVNDPAAGPLQIGRYTTAGSVDAVFYDELRFATTERSTDWIEAEYSNHRTPHTFYATTTAQSYQAPYIIDAATHNITTGGSAFFDITFNDATTSPVFVDSTLVVNGDFVIATGTVAMPTTRTTIKGSFTNNGFFMHNNS